MLLVYVCLARIWWCHGYLRYNFNNWARDLSFSPNILIWTTYPPVCSFPYYIVYNIYLSAFKIVLDLSSHPIYIWGHTLCLQIHAYIHTQFYIHANIHTVHRHSFFITNEYVNLPLNPCDLIYTYLITTYCLARTSGVARQLCARGRAMKLAPRAPSLYFQISKFSLGK